MQILGNFAAMAACEIGRQRAYLVQPKVMKFADATILSPVTIDQNGTIEFLSRAMIDLFGYDQAEMVGGEELIASADVALYRAKQDGGGALGCSHRTCAAKRFPGVRSS